MSSNYFTFDVLDEDFKKLISRPEYAEINKKINELTREENKMFVPGDIVRVSRLIYGMGSEVLITCYLGCMMHNYQQFNTFVLDFLQFMCNSEYDKKYLIMNILYDLTSKYRYKKLNLPNICLDCSFELDFIISIRHMLGSCVHLNNFHREQMVQKITSFLPDAVVETFNDIIFAVSDYPEIESF